MFHCISTMVYFVKIPSYWPMNLSPKIISLFILFKSYLLSGSWAFLDIFLCRLVQNEYKS